MDIISHVGNVLHAYIFTYLVEKSEKKYAECKILKY